MNRSDYVKSFLDDREQALITQFVNNDRMREAVRKVMLAGAYHQGTLRKGKVAPDPHTNFALVIAGQRQSNEEAGAHARACYEALNALENAFNDMSIFKTIDEPEPKSNPAR